MLILHKNHLTLDHLTPFNYKAGSTMKILFMFFIQLLYFQIVIKILAKSGTHQQLALDDLTQNAPKRKDCDIIRIEDFHEIYNDFISW